MSADRRGGHGNGRMSGGANPGVNMVVMAPGDNVGVATRDIAPGATARDLRGARQVALEPIPQGHKIALADIAPDDNLVRYGVPVGFATAAIGAGRLAHVHNVASRYLDNDEDHYE